MNRVTKVKKEGRGRRMEDGRWKMEDGGQNETENKTENEDEIRISPSGGGRGRLTIISSIS